MEPLPVEIPPVRTRPKVVRSVLLEFTEQTAAPLLELAELRKERLTTTVRTILEAAVPYALERERERALEPEYSTRIAERATGEDTE